MKCKALLMILVALLPTYSYAQADIHFSQFYETSILRNPALTGVFENDYKFGAYFRSQWSSISNPYQTALVSGEYRLAVGRTSNDYVSFGLLGYTDQRQYRPTDNRYLSGHKLQQVYQRGS